MKLKKIEINYSERKMIICTFIARVILSNSIFLHFLSGSICKKFLLVLNIVLRESV